MPCNIACSCQDNGCPHTQDEGCMLLPSRGRSWPFSFPPLHDKNLMARTGSWYTPAPLQKPDSMSASIVFTSRFELRRDAIEGKGIRTWSVFAAFQSSGNCSRHRNNDFKCHALTKALRLLVECLGSGSSYNQRLKEEKRGGDVVLEELVASLALLAADLIIF